MPVVALAGYTNAGKSTIWNALTDEKTYAANRLFATLDARHARLPISSAPTAVVVDTVGFIRRLPLHLVASFRSTLGEVRRADVVLHVVDAAHPSAREQIEVGNKTLEDLGVDRDRVMTVYNKIDTLVKGMREGFEDGVPVSGLTGEGIDVLKEAIGRKLTSDRRVALLDVDASDGRTISDLKREGEILSMTGRADRLIIRARVSPALLGRLVKRESVRFEGSE